MSAINQNIEILSTKTMHDMWDTIYMSQSPKFITFFDGQSYKLRLIGDVVVTARHYIPSELRLDDVLSKENLEDIIRGNETTYNHVSEKIFSNLDDNIKNIVETCKTEDYKNLSQLSISKNNISEKDTLNIKRLKEIDSLFSTSNWTKCYLSNVIIREQSLDRYGNAKSGEIAILPISHQILEGMLTSAKTLLDNKSENLKISGVKAHDLHISRTTLNDRAVRNFSPQYNTNRNSYSKYNWVVNFSPSANELNFSEISGVVKYGIYNINEAIKHANRQTSFKKTGFIYKIYKQTLGERRGIEEFFDKYDNMDSKEHISIVDKNIQNLPETAFGNKQSQETIGSLEL